MEITTDFILFLIGFAGLLYVIRELKIVEKTLRLNNFDLVLQQVNDTRKLRIEKPLLAKAYPGEIRKKIGDDNDGDIDVEIQYHFFNLINFGIFFNVYRQY